MKRVPHLHGEIPLGAQVRIPKGPISDKERTGVVVGISFVHVIFTYIVLLDPGSEVEDEYGVHRAVSVDGTYLRRMDGSYFEMSADVGRWDAGVSSYSPMKP
jgi:hypothetical protein